MKNRIYIIAILLFTTYNLSGQKFVFNPQLFEQLTENQAVRVASEILFRKTFKEQKETYKEINKEIGKVLVVQKFIYNNLYNVNETLKQGKKLKYIYKYISEINRNSGKMVILTEQNAQYAILYSEVYNNLLKQGFQIANEIVEITKNSNKLLMDTFEREMVIERILNKLRSMNGTLLFIINQLEVANKIAYWKQIPILKDYYFIDKLLVQNIMNQWKML